MSLSGRGERALLQGCGYLKVLRVRAMRSAGLLLFMSVLELLIDPGSGGELSLDELVRMFC